MFRNSGSKVGGCIPRRPPLREVLLSGAKLTVASLHCSASESTGPLLCSLKDVLEELAPADVYVLGVPAGRVCKGCSLITEQCLGISLERGQRSSFA